MYSADPNILLAHLGAARDLSHLRAVPQVLFGKRTVVLPKIMYWYSDDFNNQDEDPSSAAAADAAAAAGSSSSPSLGCLLHVKRYLTGWVDA